MKKGKREGGKDEKQDRETGGSYDTNYLKFGCHTFTLSLTH